MANFARKISLLLVVWGLLFSPILFAGPPVSSSTPALGGVATSSKNLGAPQSKSFTGMSEKTAGSLSSEKSLAKPVTYSYITDNETEMITSAIKSYNEENIDEKIDTVSEDVIYRLIKYGYLSNPPKSISDMVWRDGKVYRKVKKEDPGQKPPSEPVGKSGESLSSTLDAVTRNIDERAPKGVANSATNSSVKLVEQTLPVKIRGEYKEIKVILPKMSSPPPMKTIEGVYVAPRRDVLHETLSILKTFLKTFKPTIRQGDRTSTIEKAPTIDNKSGVASSTGSTMDNLSTK